MYERLVEYIDIDEQLLRNFRKKLQKSYGESFVLNQDTQMAKFWTRMEQVGPKTQIVRNVYAKKVKARKAEVLKPLVVFEFEGNGFAGPSFNYLDLTAEAASKNAGSLNFFNSTSSY